MSLSTENPRIDISQLPSPSLRRPPPPFPKRKPRPRGKQHSWTDEELNLLAYLRHHHRWTFDQIQRLHFPSLSVGALGVSYYRLTPEDRVRRASTAAALITSYKTIGVSRNVPAAQRTYSSPKQGPSSRNSPTLRSASQHERSVEICTSSSPSSEDELRPISSNRSHMTRYNLRPNRPTIFRQRKPRYLVDRLRFPHFFESYKKHLQPHTVSDEDYAPPSHSPTPDPSDRSPSVVSSQLSEASSLELFGLEARSPRSAEHSPLTISSQSSDVSSLEFFDAEEHLSSP